MARERLKAERVRLGYTQEQMAEILDVKPRQYKYIEAGTSLGRIPMWDKLEDITGVNQRVLRENHPGQEGNQ